VNIQSDALRAGVQGFACIFIPPMGLLVVLLVLWAVVALLLDLGGAVLRRLRVDVETAGMR